MMAEWGRKNRTWLWKLPHKYYFLSNVTMKWQYWKQQTQSDILSVWTILPRYLWCLAAFLQNWGKKDLYLFIWSDNFFFQKCSQLFIIIKMILCLCSLKFYKIKPCEEIYLHLIHNLECTKKNPKYLYIPTYIFQWQMENLYKMVGAIQIYFYPSCDFKGRVIV